MQVKLAFAVATSIAADIMLLDEIIGAGDIHFMEKATERLENHLALSKIVVLASHSNNLIRRFCNKVLVLKKGEVHFFGEVEEGLAFYENSSVSLRNADGIL
jgi:ABC-2 type transport system ATP-binding protein/lipopolysaccharide transport system ATP-binding protein